MTRGFASIVLLSFYNIWTFVMYSVLVFVSVFMVVSSVFHSINYPDNSPLSQSVLLAYFCFICPFNYISL